MIEMLKYIFIEPFEDSTWLGWVLGIMTWLLGLTLLVLLWFGIVRVVDSSFLPVKEGEGVVVSKWIKPAHVQTTFITTGKALVPITTFHRTAYVVEVSIGGLSDVVYVTEDYYNEINLGEKMGCEYKSGRIRNRVYIENIWRESKDPSFICCPVP